MGWVGVPDERSGERRVVSAVSLFDSDGKLTDRDGLRSVQFSGQRRVPTVPVDRVADTKTVEAIHESTGDTAGVHVHHSDGRIDAVVTPPPASLSGTAHIPGD